MLHDVPLVMHGYGILPLEVSRKKVQPVARRNAKIFNIFRKMEMFELTECSFEDLRGQVPIFLFNKKSLVCLSPKVCIMFLLYPVS